MSSDTTSAPPAANVLTAPVRFGPFVFDPKRRLLRREEAEIALPPRVLGVLELLLARAGEVVARQELIDAVWKEAFVTDTSLAEAVSYLRQALGDDSQSPTYIQTVHRRGYRFVAAVSAVVPPGVPAGEASTGARAAETRQPVEVPFDAVRPSIVNELLPWSVAIISVAAALSALWYATNQKPVKLPILTVPIELAPGEQFDSRAPALAISPSGTMVAWSACRDRRCRLYVRDLQGLTSRVLQGTEEAAAPFFSPDELWVGFFADGKLKKVFVRGGGAVTITEASQPFGAAWLNDGSILFAPSAAGGLMRVNENGGSAQTVTTPGAGSGELSHAYPSAAPDGGVIFVIRTSPVPSSAGRLALMPNVRSVRPTWKVLLDNVDIGGAVGTEFLAFLREGGLNAVAYDWIRQTAAGVPHVLQSRVLAPHLALSTSGAMASVTATDVELSTPITPLWTWNRGDAATMSSEAPAMLQTALSPDGRMIAGIDAESLTDIWVADLERGTRARITYTAVNASPVWTADGARVVYASRRQNGFEIWSRRADGTGDEARVFARDGRHLFPASASATGDIAFVETGGGTRADVGLLRHGEAQLIAQTPFDETAPALSPDGTLLAYESDESGRGEITLVRLSDGSRRVVSRDGGARPFWSSDGRSLYFEQRGAVMSVTIDPQRGAAGTPLVVARLHNQTPVGISTSGALLLQRITDPSVRGDVGGLTVNWIEHLRRTLAPPLPTTPR